MKKTVFSVVLFSTVLGTMAPVVLADDVAGNGATTQGTVLFSENTKPTDPIVPPVKPIDPTDPNQEPDKPTGNKEALRIDLAPNFYFGQWTVGSGNHVANNVRQNSNLQVTDGRGTLAGWTVSVARTEFKNGDHTLPAQLTFTPGTVKDGKNQATILAGNVKNDVVVTSTAQPIFAAAKNEGGGTYYQNFDGERAKLAFNSDVAKKGAYVSDLTWTLTSSTGQGAI